MYNIVIVENNSADAEEIKNILGEFSNNISIFTDDFGKIARQLSANAPDALILNISFNFGEGINILRLINTEKTSVIIVTEIEDRQAKLNCFKLGAADYINKPYDRSEFYFRIKNQLRTKQVFKSLAKYNSELEYNVFEKTKKLYQTHYAIIYTLASLVESRDNDAGSHLSNISFFSKILAEELSFKSSYKYIITKEFIENIPLASSLHDIGKITVRDSILLKPDRLTPEEFEFIKMHTLNGGRMLEECKKTIASDFLIDLAIDIAFYHHERWDGRGYHLGLSGEQIPLSARIVALADVYDAITSKRCYKSIMHHKEAVEYIAKQKNKHFAPDVVEAFFRHEMLFYNRKFKNEEK